MTGVGVVELLENDPRPFLGRPDVVDDLRSYYGTYEGRYFDWFGRDRSNRELASANQFDALDMLAVQALSVAIPTSTAAWLIDDADGSFFRLLATIPMHVELWDDSALGYVEDGGPADDLWSVLDQQPGIGWVVAHKLCARK